MLLIDRLIWPKDFELWFISLKDFISQFYSPVFVCIGPLEHFGIVLFLSSGFLTAILPYKPASYSLLFTVDVDTFFSWHWFGCAVMFGAVSLLSHKLVTLMKLFSPLVAFGIPTVLFVLVFTVSWCLLTV